MRCVTFSIKTNFLINQEELTWEDLHASFISKNISAFIADIYKHVLFTTFLVVLTVVEVCYVSHQYRLPNKSAKCWYFHTVNLKSSHYFQKTIIVIMEVFTNIHFLPHFDQFWQWMGCLIFQTNTNFLISQQNIHIFTQKNLHLSFDSKNKIK